MRPTTMTASLNRHSERCDGLKRVLLAIVLSTLFLLPPVVSAEAPANSLAVPIGPDPFLQIDNLLPTPNESRLASGAPGPEYWQQRVNYDIEATLDEDRKMIRGRERIQYENHSPHRLSYLWLQLDANQFSPHSDPVLSRTWKESGDVKIEELQRLIAARQFDGSMQILGVKDAAGKDLHHAASKGLLRVDLPTALLPGETFTFDLRWEFLINNSKLFPGRTGYEPLDDGNAIFALAHWYPRLCAYTDYGGWRLKGFLGMGEFTLEFGDFNVTLNVPADHFVAATGSLLNPADVLSPVMQTRLQESDTAAGPVFIVNREEADAKRKATSSSDLKTWKFNAGNVRDFAFASSRTFLVDAWGRKQGDKTVRCMSLYPREGMPLWDRFATHALAHTLEVYSEMTGIPYPWPHVTAVMGVVWSGMEYPMISFNTPRPEKDGTYSESTKQQMIGTLIHETGHNWFPMIVNNDERHWMWLDEGINTFLHRIAEQRWSRIRKYEAGEAAAAVGYVSGTTHQPIMSQPDNLQSVGGNAYRKTASGLSMLRETILGREQFDFAFKEYCRRWAYKRPEPADFFRTFEDASGVDLDWFWRGWFFSTAQCDMEVTAVIRRRIDCGDPAQSAERQQRLDAPKSPNLALERDADVPRRAERYESLRDFYETYDPHAVTEEQQEKFQKFLAQLTPAEKELLQFELTLYEVRIHNHGELPMPLILKLEFEDGTTDLRRLPVEIWRQAGHDVAALLVVPKPVTAVTVDPYNETADVNYGNNRFPRSIIETSLPLTKPEEKIENPLHDKLERERKAKAAAEKPATP